MSPESPLTPIEERGRAAALDLHEESATVASERCDRCAHRLVPDARGKLRCEHCACIRWPARLRLLSSTGDLVPGRCGSTRLCPYCAKLAAVETAEMLAIDAAANGGPSVWLVLGTREHRVTPEQWREARMYVLRAIRRRFPAAEYVAITEFTTGYGARSGGKRRPHLNLMLKNIDPARIRELRSIAVRAWRRHMDADWRGQHAGVVSEAGGLMRYLALHFLKESQQPPRGWKGHRCVTSRGYYDRPTWKVRRDAREALREKRAVHRAIEDGHHGVDAEVEAGLALARADAKRWQMVKLVPVLPARGRVLIRDEHNGPLREAAIEPGTHHRGVGEVVVVGLDGKEPTVARPDNHLRLVAAADNAAAGRALDELRAAEWAALNEQATSHKVGQETLDLQGKALNELSRPLGRLRGRSR